MVVNCIPSWKRDVSSGNPCWDFYWGLVSFLLGMDFKQSLELEVNKMPNRMRRRELGYEPIGKGVKVSVVLVYNRELTKQEKIKLSKLMNKLGNI